jgi:hypothetical protein
MTMRTFIAVAVAGFTAFGPIASAAAACSDQDPQAITSKSAEGKSGIAEDGQHMPLETDPNAPGVTQAPGGVTTNTEQAEQEIAAATSSATGASTGGSMQAGSSATTGSTASTEGCTN